jgi:hypothetical protein
VDVIADVTRRPGLLDASFQEESLIEVLTADVDEGDIDLERVGSDQQPFDELVGVLVDELAILEAARLGLVRVAAEIAGEDVLGEESPLRPGGETGSPAPPSRS